MVAGNSFTELQLEAKRIQLQSERDKRIFLSWAGGSIEHYRRLGWWKRLYSWFMRDRRGFVVVFVLLGIATSIGLGLWIVKTHHSPQDDWQPMTSRQTEVDPNGRK